MNGRGKTCVTGADDVEKRIANQVKQTGGTGTQLEPVFPSFRRSNKPQVHVYI